MYTNLRVNSNKCEQGPLRVYNRALAHKGHHTCKIADQEAVTTTRHKARFTLPMQVLMR